MTIATRELPRVTVDDIMSWNPCWADDGNETAARRRIEGRAKRAGVDSADALDLLAWPRVSAEDRLWLVIREDVVPAEILHEFAWRIAHLALRRERRRGREPDQRSWAAIDAKRAWLRVEISDLELAAAGDAAWDAARAAAGDAAWDAAWAAAWDAAREAARAAAWDAAWAAAWDAAEEAERENQSIILAALIRRWLQDGGE